MVQALLACGTGTSPLPPRPAVDPPEIPVPGPEVGSPSVPLPVPPAEAPPVEDAAWEVLPLFDQGVSRSVKASAPRFDASGQLWISEARSDQIGSSLMGVVRWDGTAWRDEDFVSTDGMHSTGFSLARDAQGRMLVGWSEVPYRGSDPVLLWRQGTGLMPRLQTWPDTWPVRATGGTVLSNAQGQTVYVWREPEADGVHRTLRSLRIEEDGYRPFAPPLPLPDVGQEPAAPLRDTQFFALDDEGGLVAAVFGPEEGLHLWRWQGDAWTELPSLPDGAGLETVGFRIAAEAGALVVSRSRADAGKVMLDVFRWKDGSWEALPTGVSMARTMPPSVGVFAAVAVDARQRVWLAYPSQDPTLGDVRVMLWTGAGWQPVGQPLRGYEKPRWAASEVELRVQGAWAALAWSEPTASGAGSIFVAQLRAKP
ncbi:hypothetical protein [Stigmatella erecta]|uniref:hypothetical protein n=1 Tax=Stigmatella erecta TaxID=83460 RepID=UPI000B857FBC|nr:hypothetical protein [Stigmatella erecta]